MNTRNKGSNKLRQGPKRAIIYTRVSTDDQAQGYSLRAQEERLESYCALQNIVVVEHFQDDASAKTFERPGFNRLLEYIDRHRREVDLLLFVKWDRFSRSASDAYSMIRRLHDAGIEAQAIEQPVDTNIPENKLMLAFYLAAPEVENDRRSLNTKAGMRRAMREGRWVNNPPKGYRPARDAFNKPLMVPDGEAPLVIEAFTEIAKGIYTQEEVRTRLYGKGFKCSRAQFTRMLRNPLYAGKIEIPAWSDEDYELVDGLHEPLVSIELFERVQEVVEKRKNCRVGNQTRRHEELPLRGHLICPRCGGSLTGGPSYGNGGTYYYYNCQGGCKERHAAERLNTDFVAYLQTISIAPEVGELYLAIVEDIYRENEGDREKELSKIRMELTDLDDRLLRVDEKYAEDRLELDSYRRLTDSYKAKRKTLERRQADIEATDSNFLKYARYGLSLLTNLPVYYQDAPLEIKQEIVGSIFPEKLIYENRTYRTTTPSNLITLLRGKNGDSRGLKSETDSPFGLPVSFGTAYESRTRATAVRGRRPNH